MAGRPPYTVKGNPTSGAGKVVDMTPAQLRTIITSDGWNFPAGEGGGPHTHPTSDVTGLDAALASKADATATTSALAGKAATSHSHAISDTTGLQTAIDGKAATSHTHAVSGITGVTAARVLGSVAGGAASELTASQVVDLIGSTRGSLIYRGASAWSLLGQGSAGQVLTSGGAGVDPTWTTVAGGGDSVVVLGADVASDPGANVLKDVTGLSFQIVAGETYWFEFVIPYTAAATTTGSRWVLNGPTLTSLYMRSEYTLTATTMTDNTVSAYNMPAACNLTSLTTGNVATLWGLIRCSANGNAIVRFASEVLNSAVTAKAGALVRYRRTL